MSVADLEAELSKGAEEVGRGHFRVDSARALAKLRDFRLNDPHHYVLELLRAAAANGATSVVVRNDSDDFELTFDGPPFPADALSDLFGCAFMPGDEGATARLRFLALGVTGALALRPSFVDVRSGDQALRILASGKTKPLPMEQPQDGTHVHVRERVGWSVLRDFFTGDPPEARAIRENARFFPCSLVVNGQMVGAKPALEGMLVTREYKYGALHLIAGVPAEPPAQSALELDIHGVRVASRSLTLKGAQVIAWARHDSLRRNASGSDVVESDPTWLSIVERLEELASDLVAALADEAPKSADAREALRRIARSFKARKKARPPQVQREPIERARLLPGPAGELSSIAQLKAELLAGRPVRVATKAYPAEVYQPPVVLLAGFEGFDALIPEGPRRDIDEEVQRRLRREENKRRWQASPIEEPRVAREGPARAEIEADQMHGEVVLVEANAPVVRFLKEGRLLVQREVPVLRPLRVRAVVDSPLIMPDAAWQDVEEDVGFTRLVAAVRKAAERALIEALAAADPPETVRRHGRDLLARCAWLAGDSGQLGNVPMRLRGAPVLPLVGGGFVSIEEIRGWPEVLWAARGTTVGLLSGAKVLALEDRDGEALELLLGHPLTDARPRLARERKVREKLAGPKQSPRLGGAPLVKVPVRGDGLEGEVGLTQGAKPRAEEEARLRFDAAGGQLLEGTFCAGGGLRVSLDPARARILSPKARSGVEARLEFLPGGQLFKGVVARADEETPLAVRVPAGATSLDVWFRHFVEGPNPKEAFERSGGASWRFPVAPTSYALEFRLLREGIEVEHGSAAARFCSGCIAVVECAQFEPSSDFDAVLTGEPRTRALAALEGAQRELFSAALEKHATPLSAMPPPVSALVSGFLVAELGHGEEAWREPDEIRARALDAPLFAGAHGPVSLRRLAEAARAVQAIWVLPPGRVPGEVPPEMLVTIADDATRDLLHAVVGLPCQNATEEIAAALAHRAFLAQPAQAATLPDAVGLRTAFATEGFQGLIGFAPGEHPSLELRLQSRPFYTRGIAENESWDKACFGLPLRALIDLPAGAAKPGQKSLAPEVEAQVAAALRVGARQLVAEAVGAVGRPECRALLLEALAMVPRHGQAHRKILDLPLLPTLDGTLVRARHLSGFARVAFATQPFPAELWPAEPVVMAQDELVRRALLGLGEDKLVDVTVALSLARDERQRLESAPRVEAIRAPGEPLHRRAFKSGDIEGEVALVGWETDEIQLFIGRRPFFSVPFLGSAAGVTAAANCDRLVPRPDEKAVRVDPAFIEVREAAFAALDELGAEVAGRWPSLSELDRRALGPTALRLAAWLAVRGHALHPLLELPLFVSSEGAPLSGRQLLEAQRRFGHVKCSDVEGILIGQKTFLWMPRPGERDLFGPLLRLVNETRNVKRAAAVLSRPQVAALEAPVASRFRLALDGEGLQGELALPPAPTGQLELHVFHDRRPIETAREAHPCGAVVALEAAALRFNAGLTKALRDAAFDRTLQAVGSALDLLLARLLREGGPDDWRAWLPQLVDGWLHRAGPVAEALLALPAFADLAGAPLSVGAVLARAAAGPVPIGSPGRLDIPEASGVVAAGEPERALLQRLGVAVEDRTEPLRRLAEVHARRNANRLKALVYEGEALVRLPVDSSGWRGELALPSLPPVFTEARVRLCREQIAVDSIRLENLGVAGVLDHSELKVSPDWDDADLGEPERAFVREQVRDLFARLAATFGELSDEGRSATAVYALRFAAFNGVTAPAHLDRLTGPAALLARCKAFRTADGRWTDLMAVADRVLRRGDIEVVAFPLVDEEAAEHGPTLRAQALDESWIDELATLFGEKSVTRIADRAAWKAHVAREDPDDRTPLGAGLRRLRQEAQLLHSAAFGKLGAEELKEIRVHRAGGGGAPVFYDPHQALAFLDIEHEGVRRALEQSDQRADRLYVLLASIYGAINRAFEHVTDEDEARLAAALLDHLADGPER